MKLDFHVLQSPLYKLKAIAIEQLEENPVLELENDEDTTNDDKQMDQFLTYLMDGEIRSNSQYSPDVSENTSSVENQMTVPRTLEDHLIEQMYWQITDETDIIIGKFIIGNLDENGYLKYTTEEIANSLQMNINQIVDVLHLIQTFDPLGVAAHDLRECLLIQLKAKAMQHTLTYTIIDQHVDLLEKRKFNDLVKILGIPLEKIKVAIHQISKLEPKPGLQFNNEQTVVLVPDAVIKENEDGYEVIMNSRELPRIIINKTYINMIKKKDAPQEAKEYLRERLEAARSFIQSIRRRQQTTQDVIEAIVKMQRNFFDQGVEYLNPMTLEEIAAEVGKDKSTVSRTVNNKYVQTSWGIIELKYFFDSAVKQEEGANVSSENIKAQISDLIKNEDKKSPLSDQKIVELLHQNGITVSRRAITKYRNQLNILPSPSRQE